MLHKPKGVTTTLADKFAAKKVIDFLPLRLKTVYPVGRLDKNSTGLLILTNDGDLCFRATHPKFSIEKEYLVEVEGLLTPREVKKAKQGIRDEEDFLKVKQLNLLSVLPSQIYSSALYFFNPKSLMHALISISMLHHFSLLPNDFLCFYLLKSKIVNPCSEITLEMYDILLS